MKYHHTALGGTFDHLHEGHKYIIDFALEHADKVSIAVATENLFKHKQFNETIEHLSYRKSSLEKYLRSKNVIERVSLTDLNNIYGTALSDISLDSIVATYETEPNAVRINEERKKKGLEPLEILLCPLLKGSNGSIIRSTNIRAGIIDRKGLPYERVFKADVLYLPEKLRDQLQKPLANPIFLKDENTTAQEVAILLNDKTHFSIAIGDIVNQTLQKAGFIPDIQVIDFKTRRQTIEMNLQTDVDQYKNDPGTLSKQAVSALNTHIQKTLHDKTKRVLVIDGEEDLLTLPAILFAPLNVYIVYGQFEEGIVILPVTEELKEKVFNIVNQFTTTPQ